MNPRRFEAFCWNIVFIECVSLWTTNERSKMLGHVVGVPVDYTSRLPAHEVADRIRAESVDAVQVSPPFSPGLHRFFTDRPQRHTCRRVPDVVLFVDAPLSLPSGIPVGVVAVSIQVDGYIHPVARWRDLKLAMV